MSGKCHQCRISPVDWVTGSYPVHPPASRLVSEAKRTHKLLQQERLLLISSPGPPPLRETHVERRFPVRRPSPFSELLPPSTSLSSQSVKAPANSGARVRQQRKKTPLFLPSASSPLITTGPVRSTLRSANSLPPLDSRGDRLAETAWLVQDHTTGSGRAGIRTPV